MMLRENEAIDRVEPSTTCNGNRPLVANFLITQCQGYFANQNMFSNKFQSNFYLQHFGWCQLL